jgi:hypothetical protein
MAKDTKPTEPADAPKDAPAAGAPKRPSVLERIQKASAMADLDKGKLLISGPSGAGKTRMGSLMPGRVLMGLSEKQAVATIKRWRPDASVFAIETFDDLVDFAAVAASPRIADHFDSVVLDSLTDMQRIMKQHLTRQQDKRKDVTDKDTWGVVIDKTMSLVRAIRDAKAHVLIITGNAEEHVDGVGMVNRPDMQGKRIPSSLPSYVQAQGYEYMQQLGNGKLRRSVMFSGPERFAVKSYGDLQPIEPPEPVHIISKCLGGSLPIPDDVKARVDAWVAVESEQ